MLAKGYSILAKKLVLTTAIGTNGIGSSGGDIGVVIHKERSFAGTDTGEHGGKDNGEGLHYDYSDWLSIFGVEWRERRKERQAGAL
jgi:hypothetical protein